MMTERTPACKFVASDQPRILPGRHGAECPQNGTETGTVSDYRPPVGDSLPETCAGCLVCAERHCLSCGRNHVEEQACAECISTARDDLGQIAYMCGYPLLEEVLLSSATSEAAMLLGPAANTDAWQHRAMSAMVGRVDASYLEDNRDEHHPAWVLGWIENEWREAFDQPTDLKQTIARSAAYIGDRLHVVAGALELPNGEQAPEFDDAKRRLAGLRSHLEDVLQEGERDEKGAPCVQCARAMVRVVTDQGLQDAYHCKPCRRTVTGNQYRYAVGVAYRAHSDRLTASDMLDQYGVKGGSVRGWASKGLVRKRGKDANGLQLYDVADVLAAAGKNLEEVS